MGNSPYCCHPFVRHIEWMRSLLFETLKPDAVNLVGHDWGAAIGLGVSAASPSGSPGSCCPTPACPRAHGNAPLSAHPSKPAMS
jgi:haloalkane dehalogenase